MTASLDVLLYIDRIENNVNVVLSRLYPEMTHKMTMRRKVRISCRTFNLTRHLWPKLRQMNGLRQYCYLSHKLLRWFTIFNLALAFLFVESALAFVSPMAALFSAAIVGLFLALGAVGVRLFSAGYEVLTSFTAAGIGVIHSLRGRRHVTWTPAGSTR